MKQLVSALMEAILTGTVSPLSTLWHIATAAILDPTGKSATTFRKVVEAAPHGMEWVAQGTSRSDDITTSHPGFYEWEVARLNEGDMLNWLTVPHTPHMVSDTNYWVGLVRPNEASAYLKGYRKGQDDQAKVGADNYDTLRQVNADLVKEIDRLQGEVKSSTPAGPTVGTLQWFHNTMKRAMLATGHYRHGNITIAIDTLNEMLNAMGVDRSYRFSDDSHNSEEYPMVLLQGQDGGVDIIVARFVVPYLIENGDLGDANKTVITGGGRFWRVLRALRDGADPSVVGFLPLFVESDDSTAK